MMRIKIWLAGLLFLPVSGCGYLKSNLVRNYDIGVPAAISKYANTAPQITLGDSKEKVMSLLVKVEKNLQLEQKKRPEIYFSKGKVVEILYCRSGWQRDGLTTDDEFTPYVFENGILVAIGWESLGGPKTSGYSRRKL